MNETDGILNILTTSKMDVKIRFNTDFPVKSRRTKKAFEVCADIARGLNERLSNETNTSSAD